MSTITKALMLPTGSRCTVLAIFTRPVWPFGRYLPSPLRT